MGKTAAAVKSLLSRMWVGWPQQV